MVVLMPWFRLEDNFHQHPKVARAGNTAVGLWVRCGTYSAAYLTDGHVPAETARLYGRQREIDTLVEVGLWIPDTNGGGYLIRDFLDYNPSAEQVLADRAAARERQRRAREAARRSRSNGQ
jgi:hypothetical protein